jgi:hypothetical protein
VPKNPSGSNKKRIVPSLRSSRWRIQQGDDLDNDGIFINQKFCELVGMSKEEIRNHGWEKAVYPDDGERVRHLWDFECGEYWRGQDVETSS